MILNSSLGNQEKKLKQTLSSNFSGADGELIPRFVIFPRKTLNPAFTLNFPPGTVGHVTNKGWVNTDAFRYWIEKVFIPRILKGKPVLLIFDGHGSHIDYLTSKVTY